MKLGRPKKGEVRGPVVKAKPSTEKRREYWQNFQRRRARQPDGILTYGEAWIAYMSHPDYYKNEDFSKSPPACPKRMSFDDAITYYKAKLQNVWDELYPVKTSEFLKVDDYFDYHEAKRVVNNIILGVAV